MDRSLLYEKILKRTEKMIQGGLIDEVFLLQKKYPLSCKPFQSVGYKETLSYLAGEIDTIQHLIELIALRTRHLARRQLTWFRRDAEIQWV